MVDNVTVLHTLLSCPSDIHEEKAIVENVLHKWNRLNLKNSKKILFPVRWDIDAYSEAGSHPQDILNNQIVNTSDILIGIFWTRIGTRTLKFDSGTVEEIELFISSGKHVMLFFCKKPVDIDSVDMDQYERLKMFKSSIKDRSLFFEYHNVNEFQEKLFDQLSLKYSTAVTSSARKQKPLSAKNLSTLACILEFNNHNINPKIADIKGQIGYEKQELKDILATLVKLRLVSEKFVSGNDPVYYVLAKGRGVIGKNNV